MIEVAADQTVDVLGGAGRRVQPVLEQGAALEQEQVPSLGVDRTLHGGDRDRGRDEPAEPAALCLVPELALGLGDPGVEDLGRDRLLGLLASECGAARPAGSRGVHRSWRASSAAANPSRSAALRCPCA